MNPFDHPQPERRLEERVPVRLRAEIKEVGPAEIQEMFPDSGRPEVGFLPLRQVHVLNLSLGGAMAGMDEEPVRNRLLALALHLPSQAPVYALAQTAWATEQKGGQHPWYAGLRFLAISREDAARIQSWLHHNRIQA